MTEQPATAPSEPPAGLLACCRYLALHAGHDAFASLLDRHAEDSGPESAKKTLGHVMRIARQEGLATVIHRPGPEQLSGLSALLPVVAELRSGRYCILAAIETGASNAPGSVTLIESRSETASRTEQVSIERFQLGWTGGILRFEPINTALVCFLIVARDHMLEVTRERLQHEYGLGSEEIPAIKLLRMAKELGLKARRQRLDWAGLLCLKRAYPAIARMRNGRHVVLTGIARPGDPQAETKIACYDPLAGSGGEHLRLRREEFELGWSGELYLLKRVVKLGDEQQPFSLRWFIPEILRQKLTFFDVALAVMFINGLALITPLFYQIVIDKVLVNQAVTTLQVLGIGMVAALAVTAGLEFLRDYLLLHATNKIDLRITTRTFRHLLNLPLDFFEHVTAGVLTKHMQQSSKIRGFLTGNLFLTVLETSSLCVYLPFLFHYSVPLTAIVLVITALITGVIAVLIVPFKRRLNALYDAEGNRQALLVEAINGMATVKAMAIEPLLRMRWEQKVARAIGMEFRVGQISVSARALTQLLDRLMSVILIWVGARYVFSGTLSVGALIAFQMLAGRVTSPLVRLVGLAHQYQEAALSVEKLGLVMNARPERGADRHGARPSLRGDIVLDRVNFRYAPDLPYVLKDVSLTIPAGITLGVVGPSGSGKTTLTRLLQKMVIPSSGTIRIGGCYLSELDTAHLRRHTGVVLQESFLFRATVAENIRSGQSAAAREQIIQAAILAGADEFIVNLPQGYDTLLEEGARNLSGGQRQRLAIARALLTRPDILILDEATSSLDPESERVVRENLKRIARNRTTIIVSHRLSMITAADSIIVMQNGMLVGLGTHAQLLQTCMLYRNLWRQQMELR